MKFKPIIIILTLFLLVHLVFAADQKQTEYDITSALSQSNNEVEIPQGQNAVASLPLFSRTYLRVYEGTKIDFNIVDPDTGVVLIPNSLVIKQINKDSIKVLLSTDNKAYEETTIKLGDEMQLNYTYKFMPFMILNPMILHYSNESVKSNVVLFFNVPFLKSGKSLQSGLSPSTVLLDSSSVKAAKETKSSLDIVAVSMIIIIMVLVMFLIYFKKIRKSKHH